MTKKSHVGMHETPVCGPNEDNIEKPFQYIGCHLSILLPFSFVLCPLRRPETDKKKIDKVPLLKNDTFGSLEKGILYLNPSSSVDEFQVKICLPILHHMANILKVNAEFYLPIFDLDPNPTWEDNESSDVHVILLKIWNLCQSNPDKANIDIGSILPLKFDKRILVQKPGCCNVSQPENRIASFKDLVAFKRSHENDAGIELLI